MEESGGLERGVLRRRLSSWSGRGRRRGVAPRDTGISAAIGVNGLSRSLVGRETPASLRLWNTLILLSRDSSLCVCVC